MLCAGSHSPQTKPKRPQLTFPITWPPRGATAAPAFLWSAGPRSSEASNKTHSVFGKYCHLGLQRATRRGEVTCFLARSKKGLGTQTGSCFPGAWPCGDWRGPQQRPVQRTLNSTLQGKAWGELAGPQDTLSVPRQARGRGALRPPASSQQGSSQHRPGPGMSLLAP